MSHYYGQDGSTQYRIIGSNGIERDTTLRDAKKLNLVPSVTTILQIPAKPALYSWLQDQLLNAVLRCDWEPNLNDETKVKQWKGMLTQEAQKIGRDAAKRGSEMHDSLERYFISGEIDEKDKSFILPVVNKLTEHFGKIDWEAEKSFASYLGFGGKVDLSAKKESIILDFKTKKDKAFEKDLGYSEHCMQLAAYGTGLGLTRLDNLNNRQFTGRYFNLFISTQTPGKVELKEWTMQEVVIGWEKFQHLLEYWKLEVGYDSSFEI